MATLVHGTTRYRAECIIRDGPNPRYREPGGVGSDDGFSTYLELGPFPLRSPDEYARGKASQCPNQGGPVILVIEDVPEIVIDATSWEEFSFIEPGLIQFDTGHGLEELLAVWPQLGKHIRDV